MAAGELDAAVTIVLEGQARSGGDEGGADGVVGIHGPGEGDDTIAAVAGMHGPVVVVTADRGLAVRVRAAHGTVVGPRWLLDRLLTI